MSQTINITISKTERFKSVESLLFKYGDAIENAENYMQVFNAKAEHGADAVDNRVLSDSFDTRAKEAMELLRDFMEGEITHGTEGNYSVQLSMPSRWIGRGTLLQSAVDRYVEDGMMNDWLNVTAPNEAAIYATRITQDETAINVELYKKGAPQ